MSNFDFKLLPNSFLFKKKAVSFSRFFSLNTKTLKNMSLLSLIMIMIFVRCTKSMCKTCPTDSTAGDYTNMLPEIDCFPTGNEPNTKTALNVQGRTNKLNEREFLINFGLVSDCGSNSTPPTTPYHDKVTLYSGIVGEAGTGDIWSINPLVTQKPQSGNYNAQGIELDFNNMNAHRGDEDAGAGLSEPVSYGLAVTGAGTFRSTSAFLVSGPGTMPIWNRGIVFANDAIKQSTFQDLGNGHSKSIDIRGSPTFGIYQSNVDTKNFFAGKTGIGTSNPRHALEISSGNIFLNNGGRILVGFSANSENNSQKTRAAVLSSERVQTHEVVYSGNVRLGQSGHAKITCCDSQNLAVDEAVYTLTPVGSPAPGLYVSKELSLKERAFEISLSGGDFEDNGGNGIKVSWTVRVSTKNLVE